MLIVSQSGDALIDMTGNIIHITKEGNPYPGYHIMDKNGVDLGKFSTHKLAVDAIENIYKFYDKNKGIGVYHMPLR